MLMATKKCPVCDWEIKDAGIAVKTGGKQITVCCDDCAKKVKENPANYARTAK
jgi:ribosome-binding protein aMBF1 (putative translation factor)